MPNTSTLIGLGLGIGIGVAALLESSPASACGGLFCSTQPVVQTAERIVFAVDQNARTVQCIINIQYAGPSTSFAWLLPLGSVPASIDVGSSYAFQVAEQLTATSFNVRFENPNHCGYYGGSSDAGAASGDAGAAAPGGNVNVIEQAPVGPYDSAVIQGTDANAVGNWLSANGYQVPPSTLQKVTPYIQMGDVLVALKLRKDNVVGDIQPISITIPGLAPVIPIRLTALAAQPNMDVTAWVLGQSRSVPNNYLEVTPDFVRLNWLSPNASYKQLVRDAVNEAGGHAFVTEFAGASNIFQNQIWLPMRVSEANIRAQTTLGGFFDAIGGIINRPEMSSILVRDIPASVLQAAHIDPMAFANCPRCYTYVAENSSVAFDPTAAADEIVSRIIKPDQTAQALFDRFPYLTRLYTQLSPDQMTLDPEFAFNSTLGDVSNVHGATLVEECGGAGQIHYHVMLDDGTAFDIDASGNLIPADSGLPAATMITDTSNGKVVPVKDNQAEISARLMMGSRSGGMIGAGGTGGSGGSGGNGLAPPADHGACTCIHVEGPLTAGASVLLVAGLFLARRRRR